MNLTYTLLTDGSSDKTLVPIIDWTLEQIPDVRFRSQYAEVSLKPSVGLLRRAEAAVKFYECDILLVHRDAETLTANLRIEEIRNHLNALGKPFVPVVPIRMTEAWLLIDEPAIRLAASNPNGRTALDLPKVARLEDIPNPKNVLFEKLKLASGLPAGRLRKFSPEACRHRVADLISDFSALRNLSAFAQFENELLTCVQELKHGVQGTASSNMK